MRRVVLVLVGVVAAWAGAAEARIPLSADAGRFAAPAAVTAAPAVAPGRPGKLVVVPGRSRPAGTGPVLRYAVEVEGGIAVGPREFADVVHAVLSDRRSWRGAGRVSFARVSSGRIDLRVTLARPHTVDRLCAPLPTNGSLSCASGGRALLNLRRWRTGAAAFDNVGRYRRYLVNHEVGHLLGHGHLGCPAAGAPAPVMMQQTKGVGSCRANPWPLPYERG